MSFYGLSENLQLSHCLPFHLSVRASNLLPKYVYQSFFNGVRLNSPRYIRILCDGAVDSLCLKSEVWTSWWENKPVYKWYVSPLWATSGQSTHHCWFRSWREKCGRDYVRETVHVHVYVYVFLCMWLCISVQMGNIPPPPSSSKYLSGSKINYENKLSHFCEPSSTNLADPWMMATSRNL